MVGRRQGIKAARRAAAEGAIDLTQVRRWYDETQNGNGNGSGAGSSSAGTENTEHMIPKSRLDEALQRVKDAEDKLKTYQDQETENQRKRGEWETIATNAQGKVKELEPYQQRASALEKHIAESNKALIERVPETSRWMIPTDYPPERLNAWLTANWDRITAKPAPSLDEGAGAGAGGATITVTDADRAAAERASQAGYPVKPEDIAKRRVEKEKHGSAAAS